MWKTFIQANQLQALRAKKAAQDIKRHSPALNAAQKTEVLLWRNRENRELETARFA
mgnify:FL=1